MSRLVQDVRFALRLLWRTPAVPLVAIASLALGIGANTTVFTLVNAILLNPLPVRDVSRLVFIQTTEVRNGAPVFLNGTSRLNFEDLRAGSAAFAGLAAYRGLTLTFDAGGDPERVAGELVSGGYFDAVGLAPTLGRLFTVAEAR